MWLQKCILKSEAPLKHSQAIGSSCPPPDIVAKNGGRLFLLSLPASYAVQSGEWGFSVLALLFPGTFCNTVQVSSAQKSKAMVMTPKLRTTSLEPWPSLLCLFPLTTWLYLSGFCVLPLSSIPSSFRPVVVNIAALIRPVGKQEWPVACLPCCLVENCQPLVLGSSLLCSVLTGPHPSCAPSGLSADGVNDKEKRAHVTSVSSSG